MKGYGTIGLHQHGWIEKERPVAGPLDAILRPIAVAPCSSDTHAMHGGSGEKKNIIMGHESVGEVGNLVTNFKPAI